MYYFSLLLKAFKLFSRKGLITGWRRILRRWRWERSYRVWLAAQAGACPAPAARSGKVKISILMPVYNTPADWLRQAIESVREQTYSNWELRITDDGSSRPEVRHILDAFAAEDPRIQVLALPVSGGISAATNAALQAATGEFIALLDHDDLLAPHALASVIHCLEQYPDAVLIYSDEDQITASGKRYSPSFKPDWNPRLLLAQNYINHLLVLRTSVVKKVGGFRSQWDGCQDWDLLLRITAGVSGDLIQHLSDVLYHWRAVPGSTALAVEAKQGIVQRSAALIALHAQRRGCDSHCQANAYGYVHLQHRFLAAGSVAFIIECQDRCIAQASIGQLRSFLFSLHPCVCEIVLVNPGQAAIPAAENIRCLNIPETDRGHPWRYALEQTTADFVGLLTVPPSRLSRAGLANILAEAAQADVGIVGAKLLLADGRIFSAGSTFSVDADGGLDLCDLYAGSRLDEPGENSFAELPRTTILVRDALFARRSVFAKALTESCTLPWDVATALKAVQLGLNNIYLPVELSLLEKPGHTSSGHYSADHISMAGVAVPKRDPNYNLNLRIVEGWPLVNSAWRFH